MATRILLLYVTLEISVGITCIPIVNVEYSGFIHIVSRNEFHVNIVLLYYGILHK